MPRWLGTWRSRPDSAGDLRAQRVLFVASWYPSSSDPVAGVFIRGQARAAHFYQDVDVLAAVPGRTAPDASRNPWRPQVEDDEGLRTWRISTPPQSGIWRRFYLPVLTFRLLIAGLAVSRELRPSIIHANTYETALAAGLLGRFTGTPVVITEHYGGFTSDRMGRFRTCYSRLGYRLARLALPVTDQLGRALAAHGIDTPRVVVPNAVDTNVFGPGASPDGASPADLPSILFVGRVSHAKGVDVLLDALGGLDGEWHLTLVGGGDEVEDHRRRAVRLGLDGRVDFAGVCTPQEVAEYARHAAMLVLPSRGENLPCVVLEALCCGTPVVATRVGGIPEVVGPDNGVLVDVGDVAGLRDALRTALRTSYDRPAIARSAAETYSLPAVGADLCSAYETVVEAHSRSAHA